MATVDAILTSSMEGFKPAAYSSVASFVFMDYLAGVAIRKRGR